jgi:hypothetical protein
MYSCFFLLLDAADIFMSLVVQAFPPAMGFSSTANIAANLYK